MTLPAPRNLIFLAALGSAAMLLSAWGFQYLGGLAPCAMCIWQRWPHAIAAAAGVIGIATAPIAAVIGLSASLVGTGIALFHSGVERDWWEGPATCTSNSDIGSVSAEELLQQILDAPLVRCDEIQKVYRSFHGQLERDCFAWICGGLGHRIAQELRLNGPPNAWQF